MALRLTSATDYAIRAMIHLACLPDGAQALRDDIARVQGIPSSFMAKILRNLVRARLLRSARGVNGGFALARSATEICLLDIVEAIEGPLCLTNCVSEPPGCELTAECPAASVWTEVQDAMREILKGRSLEDLVSTPRRNGRVEGTRAGLTAELPALAIGGS